MPPRTEPSPGQIRKMVRTIIEHHFGKPPKTISEKGGGLTNHVFQVKHAEGVFIVRISGDRAKINSYIKEQWATAKAREVGVPTPEILEVGNEVVPLPYMVSRSAAGKDSTHHEARLQILHQMGHYTALIHTVRTSGFGHTFDWSSNQLSRNATWKDYLHGEFNLDSRIEVLRRHRMLSKEQLDALKRTMEATEKWKKRPSLHHGDMRLKNVLADEEGKITAVIDWENCVSSVAPYWDLSLALHDLSIDAKEEFIDGYGVSLKDFKQMAGVIKALNLLNYAPVVEQLAAAKDDRKLEVYRVRLCGTLDLYSLE